MASFFSLEFLGVDNLTYMYDKDYKTFKFIYQKKGRNIIRHVEGRGWLLP